MRIRPTVTWVTCEPTEDFEFRDIAIASGTTLRIFSPCAASDPERFAPGFDISVKRKPEYLAESGNTGPLTPSICFKLEEPK